MITASKKTNLETSTLVIIIQGRKNKLEKYHSRGNDRVVFFRTSKRP